jgi:nucleoside-diphosphate-sugar epimerase
MKIALSGSNGFVGTNLQHMLKFKFEPIAQMSSMIPEESFCIIHAGGIAHDMKKSYSEHDYDLVNVHWTKSLFDNFLKSTAQIFIFFSSIKAVSDNSLIPLDESAIPNPKTIYGKSKLNAEQYILDQNVPKGKRIYILRPCMIYGIGNKGNLNSLYNYSLLGLPWPLGSFNNQRSFCSINNVAFVINELLANENIQSGIFHLSDDEPISTNELIKIIQEVTNKRFPIISFPKWFVIALAKIGSVVNLPFNLEVLKKLSTDYVVSNALILSEIKKPFPVSSRNGIKMTLSGFGSK